MNLENRINECYDNLTANDREMLNLILKDKESSARMSSAQLAAYCHVSRTTLVRLYKKLGIASFAEFKLLMGERADLKQPAGLDMKEITTNYHRMVDDLKSFDCREICGVIVRAETIYLYGTGNEQKAIGEEFKRIFLMFGKCCIDLFDRGEAEFASRYFHKNDLFIVISLSGESENGIEVVRFVQRQDVKTLSVTRWTNNTLARMCQYNLYAGTRMIGGGEEAGYEMMAAFYILLDILSVNYLEYVRESHETGRTVQ